MYIIYERSVISYFQSSLFFVVAKLPMVMSFMVPPPVSIHFFFIGKVFFYYTPYFCDFLVISTLPNIVINYCTYHQ